MGMLTKFRVRSLSSSSVDALNVAASEAETSPMVKYRFSPWYRKMTRQLPFRFSMEAIGDNLGTVLIYLDATPDQRVITAIPRKSMINQGLQRESDA